MGRKENSLLILSEADDDNYSSMPTTAEVMTGGVFVSTRCLHHSHPSDFSLDSSTTTTSSSSDLSSMALSSCSSSSTASEYSCWQSSGSKWHHRASPLVMTDPERPDDVIEDPAKVLGDLLKKARRLPTTSWYFASNHVMVNHERCYHSVVPLKRMHELDEIAKEHAENMARRGKLFHSDPQHVQDTFHRPTRRLGENVGKGDSIADIQSHMMETKADRNNILDRRYTHFGMATAKCGDGSLYLCQIFRG